MVIDDFVKKAKWRRQQTKRFDKKDVQPDIKFNIDLDTIDLQYFGRVLNSIELSSTKRDEKDDDLQINETLTHIDVENIKMFYSLCMFIPWYTSVHFLKEYADDNRGLLAPELYKYYINTPDMIKLRDETVSFLQKRIVKTAGITNKELNNSTFKQIFKNFYDDKNNQKYTYPPPCVKTVRTKINNKNTITGGDYDNLFFERTPVRYGDKDAIDTTWLHEYGIKGFVVSDKDSVFATPIEVRYGNKTWYKVNKNFYKHIYTDKRNFIPGLIGYIMQDSSIVTETNKMFERLKTGFEIKDSKAMIISGYDVAKHMISNVVLLNNIYTVKDLNSFAEKIVESFKPCDTTKDIAKKLSFILVYYRKLIPVEQSYIENTRQKLYNPENLLNLQKDILLPEVYSLPENDPNKKNMVISVGKLITQERKAIETEFFIHLESKKLPYEGRMRVRVKMTTSKVHNQLMKGDKFAPGLIQKLKNLINFVPLTKCSLCDKNVYNLSYKSVCSGEVQTFCNQECFDKFEFKNEKNL